MPAFGGGPYGQIVDVDVAALVLTSLGTIWGIFTYFQLRSEKSKHDKDQRKFERQLELERQRHAEIVADLQQRNEVIHKISGRLREIQHCVEDHGGEPAYRKRLEQAVRAARALVLEKSSLLREQVVQAVQRETDISTDLFEQRLADAPRADTARRLAEARVRLLDSLARSRDLLQAQGGPEASF